MGTEPTSSFALVDGYAIKISQSQLKKNEEAILRKFTWNLHFSLPQVNNQIFLLKNYLLCRVCEIVLFKDTKNMILA